MRTRSPRINVTYTSVSGDRIELISAEFGGDILAVETTKTIDQPAGTFTITLIGRKDFSYLFNIPKPDKTAYEIFRPAGLVDIYINNKEIMLGMVDDVRKKVSIGQDGKPARNWVITGRDLGAILIDHKIWYDDNLNINRTYQNSILAGLSSFGTLMNLTTAQLMEKIINVWIIGVINQNSASLNVKPFQFADGSKIQDKFVALQDTNTSYTVILGEGTDQLVPTGVSLVGKGAISHTCNNDNFLMQFSMLSTQCDLYNYLKHLLNAPFNELFVDTGDTTHVLTSGSVAQLAQGKVYLVLRPTPFDDRNLDSNVIVPDAMKNNDNTSTTATKVISDPYNIPSLVSMNDLIDNPLTCHVITDDDWIEKDLGMGRNMKPSTYYAMPSGGVVTALQGKAMIPPLYDDIALRKYGYNPMQFNLNAINFNVPQETDQAGMVQVCQAFQNKAYMWYRNLDRFLRGSIVLKGDETIRIGHVLKYERTDFGEIEETYHEGYYYIVGVTNRWIYGQNYTTLATVERGVSKKEFGVIESV